MGIPKVVDRKTAAIKRLKQLGATDTEIDQAFRELEASDEAEIAIRG